MDPDTTAGLNSLFDRIERKLDQANTESHNRSRELHEKIEERATVTQSAIHKLDLKLTQVGTKFEAHEESNIVDLVNIRKAIAEGSKDRKGMWRFIAGGGISGGVIATLIDMVRGKV